MEKILDRDFYRTSSIDLAKKLLGKVLVHKVNHKLITGMITETEAYEAFIDQAAHSFKGKTSRKSALFLDAGHLYLHKIHGQICMDVVAEKENIPSSVLIRSLEPVEGIDIMIKNRNKTAIKDLTTGPGKLTQALQIQMEYYGADLCDEKSKLFILEGNNPEPNDIIKTTRIGISKAKEKVNRFYLKDNKFISKR